MKYILVLGCLLFVGCATAKKVEKAFQDGLAEAEKVCDDYINPINARLTECELDNIKCANLLKQCVNINEDGQFTDK